MRRKNKSGSIYKKSKDAEHTNRYRISLDGNYFVNLDLPWYRKLWLFFDALIFGVIYILIGLVFSWILNSYIFLPLDESLHRAVVGIQVIGESVLNVLVLYILIQLIPRIFPNIYPSPPGEHEYFRQFMGGILLSFGLLAAEYKLVAKVGYVFGRTDNLDDVIRNYRTCRNQGEPGFACGSP